VRVAGADVGDHGRLFAGAQEFEGLLNALCHKRARKALRRAEGKSGGA
jgi:hypothetical protein